MDTTHTKSLSEVLEMWTAGIVSRGELFGLLLIAANECGFSNARAAVPEELRSEFDSWARDLGDAPRRALVGLDELEDRVLDEVASFYSEQQG